MWTVNISKKLIAQVQQRRHKWSNTKTSPIGFGAKKVWSFTYPSNKTLEMHQKELLLLFFFHSHLLFVGHCVLGVGEQEDY